MFAGICALAGLCAMHNAYTNTLSASKRIAMPRNDMMQSLNEKKDGSAAEESNPAGAIRTFCVQGIEPHSRCPLSTRLDVPRVTNERLNYVARGGRYHTCRSLVMRSRIYAKLSIRAITLTHDC